MPESEQFDGMPTPVLVAYGWPRENYSNGVITYTSEIVDAMRRLGAKPRVAAFHLAEGSRSDFVSKIPEWRDVRRGFSRSTFALASKVCPNLLRLRLRGEPLLSELRNLVDRAGVDICEIEEAHGTAGFLAQRVQIPVVIRLHGPWFLNGPALGVVQDRSFERRVSDEGICIASGQGITAPSRSVLEAVRSYYGLKLEGAEVIPNPVHPVRVEGRWNLQTSTPDQILFVGRFDRHKGGDVIIDALLKIRHNRPNCRLLFAGMDTGIELENGGRIQLKEYIDARAPGAVDAGIIQCLGLQPPERLAELRRQAMVTVICSRYENFPMAALEAMAMGCPVVGTEVGGIPEIVQHQHNGLLCRAGDSDDLAAKTLALLDHLEFAARLGAQAAIDAESRYHPDKIARQTLAFYRRVIDAFHQRGEKSRMPMSTI